MVYSGWHTPWPPYEGRCNNGVVTLSATVLCGGWKVKGNEGGGGGGETDTTLMLLPAHPRVLCISLFTGLFDLTSC